MALPTIVSPVVMQPIPKFKGTAAASTAAPTTCTHTFDAWRNFAVSYAAQRSISGKYGVDFRFAPEPTGGDRRTLKLLDTAARCLGPNILKRSAVQFDFIENTNARVQHNYPCAQPSAHVAPSTSSQLFPSRIQTHAQPQIQQTISTSSSATPRASPEQERPQVRLQHNGQQQQDPLHDIFFNFDLASPSDASAPPDTDGEQEHDTEGTDTESERELRLSDLEGPVALRHRAIRRRGRRARRVRAGSISTNSTSSGPGMSPVSPTAMRSGRNVQTSFSSANPNMPASALCPAYARHSSALSSTQDQGLNQDPSRSQPVSGVSPHFPTSISESGVGIVGSGTGASPNGAGIGSFGLSAAARARLRGRGIGASKSEPDPEVTPTNTAGTTSGPGSGAMQMRGDYNVGPYGYRYPVHPPYPAHGLDTSASQMQVHAQEYAPPSGLGTVKEETPTSILNWQASTSTVGIGTSMEIDLDLGGWGKVSEPLPGMDLGFGMHYTSPYVNQGQTHQGSGAYQNQTYSHQSPYSQQRHQQSGMTGTFSAQMPYYTSPTLTTHAQTGTAANVGMTVNPSLNMSPSK
ncbi:hypothetical protein A7U60_g4022 [Sanghuangporus baumii]|uniref:Uncharacterized protein n=1 Tax=Sanghuangporus baumii TaxID=108892 RepID=A0A9Q5NCP6_SANBA|nr:hypothetical protein A7U60_g4022 [Sanghuangporus baumii]